MSHPFQLDVAKTIHLSGKAVTSAKGRYRLSGVADPPMDSKVLGQRGRRRAGRTKSGPERPVD
jgi:hypothetical protein